MNTLFQEFVWLLGCAVNGVTPDRERVDRIDLAELYRLAKRHSVRAAVCIALERAGVQEKHFHQAYKMAVSKNVYFDIERDALLSKLDREGIWYLPLKGCVLKDIYPENGMREMADNDVLFDAAARERVREIMTARGYSCDVYDKGNQDVYQKEPVLNFEMHVSIFPECRGDRFWEYYRDVSGILVKNEEDRCGYHLSDEDFYVFMTAHEYKHFSVSGTGIRSLLDCYVFCKSKGSGMDWDYIAEQVRVMGIVDFEEKRRKLAEKVFSSETLPALSEDEEALLLLYLTAGTYGNVEQRVKNGLGQRSMAGFLLDNLFPPMDRIKASYSFVRKCPVLYPVGVFCRVGNLLVHRKWFVKRAVKSMIKREK